MSNQTTFSLNGPILYKRKRRTYVLQIKSNEFDPSDPF